MMYFDNCATTQVFDAAADTALRFMKRDYVNSSAPYTAALFNEKELQRARSAAAASIGAGEKELFFTSGGTESDNTVLFGAISRQRDRILISATEHPAVYEAAMRMKTRAARITVLPVDGNGVVSARALENELDDKCALVSIMHVNNETGVINPVKELAELTHRLSPGCIFHSDGVQAHMRIKVNVKELGVDAYSVSAHKVHAPKGVGALYVARGTRIERLFEGGGQQEGFRSGTVNLPGIAAYASALKEFEDVHAVERIEEIKNVFLSELKGCVINSAGARTAPHIVSAAFPGLQASTLQNALEEAGVIVGKGSACSSRSSRISRTMESMGLERSIAQGTVRIGIGALNTKDEAAQACRIINEISAGLLRFKRR